jgi:hypothetical protein
VARAPTTKRAPKTTEIFIVLDRFSSWNFNASSMKLEVLSLFLRLSREYGNQKPAERIEDGLKLQKMELFKEIPCAFSSAAGQWHGYKAPDIMEYTISMRQHDNVTSPQDQLLWGSRSTGLRPGSGDGGSGSGQ